MVRIVCYLFLLFSCASGGALTENQTQNWNPHSAEFQGSNRLILKACAAERQPIEANQIKAEMLYECNLYALSPDDTALVIVDIWDAPDIRSNPVAHQAEKLLQAMRRNNFYVVHSPAEAALKYPMYQKLQKEVSKFLGNDYYKPNHLFGSANRKKIYSYRKISSNNLLGPIEPGLEYPRIYPGVEPMENRKRELMVYNEDEVRYILWKHKIKNLVYIGGAIDECLLHRAIGINSLRGIDASRTDIEVFLVEDIIGQMQNLSMNVTDVEKQEILLKSLSFKVGRITNSSSFEFLK